MSDKVVLPSGGVTRIAGRRAASTVESGPAAPVGAGLSPATADVRLIVEEPEPGRVIYVLVDARTGQVLSRQSREDVLRKARNAKYAAGSVFDTKA